MGFVEAVKSFYGRYFDFSTRSSRSEFWWAYLYICILIFLSSFLAMFIGGGLDAAGTPPTVFYGIFGAILLTHLIPWIALQIRRFHDQDRSGWLALFIILIFLPLLGIIGTLVIMVFMLLKGTRGDNRFGPDPLGDSMYDTFS